MQIQMPRFKVLSNDHISKHSVIIELEGEIIHKVEDLHEFQQALGFKADMAKNGILPDEYVWERFVKGSQARCSSCYQLHILKYLMKHSARFRNRFEEQKEEWIAALAMAGIVTGNIVCPVCKSKQQVENP